MADLPSAEAERPIAAGDVVSLKSGSFSMTVTALRPPSDADGTAHAELIWDMNAGNYGRACRLSRAMLPLHVLKHSPHFDPEGDIPF